MHCRSKHRPGTLRRHRKSMATAVWVLCLTALLVLPWASAYAQPKEEPHISPCRSCARDRTYKYFEEIQCKAYGSDPGLMRFLAASQDLNQVLESIDETGRELATRKDLPGASREDESRETSEFIRLSLRNLRLPTCYENRYVYWMLTNYAQQIDDARRSLKLPLRGRPKIASLPTTEINAYTYPADGNRDSVVAFNTQLFMFAYQMTKVTLPTIGIDLAQGSVGVDRSRATALRAIATEKHLRLNFTMALLEFLLLVDPSTQPLAPSYDPLVVTFTQGMELFAVAHEYGHVIKKHSSPTMSIRLGADSDTGRSAGNRDVSVLARSWQQELEADAIGIRLLTEVLRKAALKSESDDLRWLYSLKGALFFFKSLDLVDRAKYVRDHDRPRPTPSLSEAAFLRDVADCRATDDQRMRFRSLTLGSHPPAWLRLERARVELDKALEDVKKSAAAAEFSQIADGLIYNVDLIWSTIEDDLPRAIKGARIVREKEDTGQDLSELELGAIAGQLKQGPSTPIIRSFAPGCQYDAAVWMSSFMCTTALQRAAARFIDDAPIGEVLADYASAIRADPVLLGGMQLLWAQDVLERRIEADREAAIAVVALSGDRDGVRILESVSRQGEWTEETRQLLDRAQAFLKERARDTSVTALAALDPATFSLSALLVHPVGLPGLDSHEFATKPLLPDQKAFLANARAVDPRRSLASMALYMLQARTSDAVAYSFWADVLLRSDFVDPALRLALAGANKVGPDAALENAIGNILSEQGKLLEANVHYEASLHAGRNDGWPEVNLAKNLVGLREFDTAESWFRRAIARRENARSVPEFAGFLNEFAWFIATRRKGDATKVHEALELSRESNELVKRSNPNFLDTLAECESVLGNHAAAIAAAREALALIDTTSPVRAEFERRLAEFEARAKQ